MGDGTLPPLCPFYPDRCAKQRHPFQQHEWKDVGEGKPPAEAAAKSVLVTPSVTKPVLVTPSVTKPVLVTSEGTLTNKERQAAWRAANREKKNAEAREYQRERRAKAKAQ